MKNQKGYTLVEILVCIIGLGSLVLFWAGVYVLGHFIAKFW